MLDELALVCGFFGHYSHIVNNGYNCNHPKQEQKEFDRELHRKVGMCLRTSCPLANHVDDTPEDDLEDMMEVYDQELLLKLKVSKGEKK